MSSEINVESPISKTDVEEQLVDGEIFLKYMSPLLNSMRIFGLYFRTKSSRIQDVSTSTTVTNDNEVPKTWNVGRIYASVILVLLWINAARMLSVFETTDKFGYILLVKLASISATVLSALLQTACFVACQTGNLDRVFRDARLSKSKDTRYSRLAVIVTAVCWLLVVLDLCFVLMLFVNDENVAFMSTPFQIHVFVSGVSLICVKIMCSFSVNFIVTCVLYDQFCTLNRDFQRSFGRSGEFQGSVREFRRRHQALTQSVENADQFMMISNVAGFCCQIVILILIFYCTIFFPEETVGENRLSAAVFVIWIVTTLFGLTLTACQGAVINHVALSLAKRVFDIDLLSLDERELAEVSVFLDRLRGEPIGFSVLGIFVIEKNTVVTVLGLLVTYFILVVQFGIPFESSPATPAATLNYTLSGRHTVD